MLPTNAILAAALTRLMSEPETPAGERHWFCQLAKPVVRAAATYLVVLFTYDAKNQRVATYLSALKKMLFSCINCSEGFQQAKLDARATLVFDRDVDTRVTNFVCSYFSAFPAHKVDEMMSLVLTGSAKSPPQQYWITHTL